MKSPLTLSALAITAALIAAAPVSAGVVFDLPSLTFPDSGITTSTKTPLVATPDRK